MRSVRLALLLAITGNASAAHGNGTCTPETCAPSPPPSPPAPPPVDFVSFKHEFGNCGDKGLNAIKTPEDCEAAAREWSLGVEFGEDDGCDGFCRATWSYVSLRIYHSLAAW